MKNLIKKNFPEWKVKNFGSFYTNLFLKNSDIDLVIFTKNIQDLRNITHNESKDSNKIMINKENLNEMNLLFNYLKEQTDLISNLNKRDSARVPIITFTYKTKIKIDIAFNKIDSVQNGRIVKQLVKIFPVFRPLYLVIKYIFNQENLIDACKGKISSFILFLMLHSFIKGYYLSMKDTSDETINYNNFNLGFFFTQFFQFYGFRIEYDKSIINTKGKNIFLDKEEFFNFKKTNENFSDIITTSSEKSKENNSNLYYDTNTDNNWISFESNLQLNSDVLFYDLTSQNRDVIQLDTWNVSDETKENNFCGWEIEGNTYFNEIKENKLANQFNFEENYKDVIKNSNYFLKKNLSQDKKEKNKLYVLGFNERDENNVAGGLFHFWMVRKYMRLVRDILFYHIDRPLNSYLKPLIIIEKLENYQKI